MTIKLNATGLLHLRITLVMFKTCKSEVWRSNNTRDETLLESFMLTR